MNLVSHYANQIQNVLPALTETVSTVLQSRPFGNGTLATTNSETFMGIGELAALGAAMLWAVSSMLWGRVNLTALGINLCKNLIGTIFLIVHLAAITLIAGSPLLEASWQSLGWLSLSGLIGIVLGDTLYFRSLQILGARLSLMVASLSPLAAALLGWLCLGEGLAWFAAIGIFTTVAGVVSVVGDRRAKVERLKLKPGKTSTGIMCGIGGACTQAAGIVLSKLGMEDCGAVEAAFVRIAFAAVTTMLIVLFARKSKQILTALKSPGQLKLLIGATALGTWLGIWLSQVGVKEASSVAVAQTMLATSPLFAIPVVRYYIGHKVSWRAIAGTVVAIVGIFLTVSAH